MVGVYSIRKSSDLRRASHRGFRLSLLERTMQSVSGHRGLRLVVTAVLCSSAAGCMTAKIEEMREAPTQITADEAIVLLAKPHLEGTGTENKFLDCLERELVGQSFSSDHANDVKKGKASEARSNLAGKPFQIYAGPQFVDAFYPWLEPSTAPVNPQSFSAFLARP